MLVDLVLPPMASVIVARSLGPTKLGSFSYILWFVAIATILPSAGFTAAASRYLAAYAGQRRPDLFRALLRTCLTAEVLILSITSIVGLAWVNTSLPSDQRWFASLLMISILPAGVVGMVTAVNSAMQELRPNVVASISGALVNTAGLLLAVVMGWGLVGLASATLAMRVCDTGVRWKMTKRRLPRYLQTMGENPSAPVRRPRLPREVLRELYHFIGDSTVLAILSLVVWNRSEFFFLKRYSTIEQLAYFSVAFTLSQMPAQIVRPFSWAASVGVYAERGRDSEAGLNAAHIYWRYLVLLVLPASLGLSVISGPLLRLLYGTRYFDAAPVLMLAAILGPFGPLVNPLNTLITACGGQRRLVTAGLLAAAVTLGLDYLLVRSYAALGGALANGLGQGLFLALNLLVARRYFFRGSAGFFLWVTGAALGMASLVAIAVRLLPDLVSIIVGPPLGVLAYGLLLRATGVVDIRDVERLSNAGGVLPRPLRHPFRKMVSLLVTHG